MADNEIGFIIRTKAEMAGAEQAVKILEKNVEAAKALGQESKTLEKQIEKTTAAVNQFKTANEQLSKAEEDRGEIEKKIGESKALGNDTKALNEDLRKQSELIKLLNQQAAERPTKTAASTPEPASEYKQYKVKNKEELKIAESMVQGLEAQIAKAKILGTDYSEIEKNLYRAKVAMAAFKESQPKENKWLAELKEQLRETVPWFPKLENVAKNLTSGPLGLMAAGFAAVGSAVGLAAASIKEFMGVEDAFARLDAALARSGLLTDAYREKLAAMASELQKTTGKDDDEWLNVLTKLTQFGADASNIDAATEAVKNLAGILDGDLQGAAMMVSKALKGSFEMFGRYGLKVSETGTQTQKLNQLFEELAKRGGGQLEAQMTTLSGKTTTLWNNIKDVTKGIGGWIASTGAVQFALDLAGEAAGYLADKLEKLPDKLKGLTNASNTTTGSIEDQQKALARLKVQLDEIEKVYERQQKRLDSQQSAREKVLNAQKNYDLALVDEAVKKKRISEPEGILRKAGIEATYEDIKTQDEVGRLEQKRQGILFKSDRKFERIKNLESEVQRDSMDKFTDSANTSKNKLSSDLDQRIADLEKYLVNYSKLSKSDQTTPESLAEYADKTNRLGIYRRTRSKIPAGMSAPRLRPGADLRRNALRDERGNFQNEINNETGPALDSIGDQMGGIQQAHAYNVGARNLNTETALYGSIKDSIGKSVGKVNGGMSELGGVYNQGFDVLANGIVNLKGSTEAKIRELERRLGTLQSQGKSGRGQ